MSGTQLNHNLAVALPSRGVKINHNRAVAAHS